MLPMHWRATNDPNKEDAAAYNEVPKLIGLACGKKRPFQILEAARYTS